MRGWPRRSRGPTDPPPPIDYDAVFRRTADNVYAVCLAVLRDPAEFAKAYVHPAADTVAWPGNLDLDPDVLYARAHSIPIPDE